MNAPACVLHLPQGKREKGNTMNTRENLNKLCQGYAREILDVYQDGGLYEWLDDNALCVEALMVDFDTYDDRFTVTGCIVSLALGGPTIRVNTFDNEIVGSWYPDTCTVCIDDKLAAAITEYYA